MPHVAVAAARAQTLAPRGYNGERLPEVTLPADTWHAWFPMEERTLCGLAVTDLHQFPLLPFLPERANDLCRPCLMGARAELTAEHSEARLGAVMEYFVGSEQISQLRRPGSGPTPVPAGKLHAIRLGSITTACGIALEAVHRWREVEWSPQPGRDWCRACRTQTAP